MSLAPIAFLDLQASHSQLRPKLDQAWNHAVTTSGFVGGSKVDDFEHDFALFCGTNHAIGVGNGTDALEIILTALDIGVGDEVIVPANTFVATAEAVARCGADPVFVDVDPETLLLTAPLVEEVITKNTAAVMAVHLYGQMVDMEALCEVTQRHGIAVIEDAAQAHGATWNGRPAGSWGVAAGFSFYPGKNLGAFGDGGAITTSDPTLASTVRSISNHGRSEISKYEHDLVGRNSRLDGLQGAVLGIKLSELPAWNKRRREVAGMYQELLPETFTPVVQRLESESVFHLYVVRSIEHRREVVGAALTQNNIGWGIHYPVPCHRQIPYLDDSKVLPVADMECDRILSLPMHPHLSDGEVERVCDVLRDLGS